jgi:hypothetical protein
MRVRGDHDRGRRGGAGATGGLGSRQQQPKHQEDPRRASGIVSRMGTLTRTVRQRRAKTMAPVGGGGATVVACGGEKAHEAHNTLGFLEE